MENISESININQIREIYRDNSEEEGAVFEEKKFKEFLEFLEIDFFDWVKGNLNQFWSHKKD